MLEANGIGDVGCRALAAAIRGGALPKLEELHFHNARYPNLAGEEARAELRAACEARGVRCEA